MRRLLLLTTGVLTCCLLGLLPVWAAPQGLLPPAQTQGPVTYVRGGIGPEEAQAFAAAIAHYPLALEFAAKHRPHATFLTTVHVTVSDLQGRSVLDTRSQGPFLLATLPAGDYTINAWYRDQTLTRRVHVTTHKPVHVLFIWTASASSLTEGERAATP
jgi:hypothetical protein